MSVNGSSKPAVCQMYWRFISKSETFMYFYLTQFQRTQPVGVSWKAFTNSDLFPVRNGPMYSLETKYRSWPFPVVAAHSLLTGKRTWDEVNEYWCRRILREQHARVVHAHYGYTGYHALAIRKALGLPLVTTFYGADTAPIDAETCAIGDYRARLFAEGDLFLVEGPP